MPWRKKLRADNRECLYFTGDEIKKNEFTLFKTQLMHCTLKYTLKTQSHL